jgi:hypothetical protein
MPKGLIQLESGEWISPSLFQTRRIFELQRRVAIKYEQSPNPEQPAHDCLIEQRARMVRELHKAEAKAVKERCGYYDVLLQVARKELLDFDLTYDKSRKFYPQIVNAA